MTDILSKQKKKTKKNETAEDLYKHVKILGISGLKTGIFAKLHIYGKAEERCGTAIVLIIIWDFLIFYQVFFSLQVTRSAIISNKSDIYDLPHKLPNDLRS